MSKAAFGFLVLALVSCAVVLYAPVADMVVIGVFKAVTVGSGALFALALLLGRRIKFDPVLR